MTPHFDVVVLSGSMTVGLAMTPVTPKSPRHTVPPSAIRMFPWTECTSVCDLSLGRTYTYRIDITVNNT